VLMKRMEPRSWAHSIEEMSRSENALWRAPDHWSTAPCCSVSTQSPRAGISPPYLEIGAQAMSLSRTGGKVSRQYTRPHPGRNQGSWRQRPSVHRNRRFRRRRGGTLRSRRLCLGEEEHGRTEGSLQAIAAKVRTNPVLLGREDGGRCTTSKCASTAIRVRRLQLLGEAYRF